MPQNGSEWKIGLYIRNNRIGLVFIKVDGGENGIVKTNGMHLLSVDGDGSEVPFNVQYDLKSDRRNFSFDWGPNVVISCV